MVKILAKDVKNHESNRRSHRICGLRPSEPVQKGSEIPYISHPFGVAMILLEAQCKEEVVMAGLLHDTLEDTDTTDEDIRSRFGEEVLRLVQGASEPDKSLSWEARKEHTLEFLKSADLSTRQLSCADKLHNLRSVRRDFADLGDEVWNKFKRGYDKQKWYYVNLVESLGTPRVFRYWIRSRTRSSRFSWGWSFPQRRKAAAETPSFSMRCLNVYSPPPSGWPKSKASWRKGAARLQAVRLRADRALQARGWGMRGEKVEMFRYLTSRGIDFEPNSEGTDIIISACAAMQEAFRLYPHEVYHHLLRSLKKGLYRPPRGLLWSIFSKKTNPSHPFRPNRAIIR
ncbi:HD domain-containing protein [Paenibacillus sp. JTLBN-2024]